MRVLIALTALALVSSGTLRSAEDKPTAKDVKTCIDRGIEFLKKRQEDDGGFSKNFSGPGITALVAAALIRNGVSTEDPVVAKALKYLENKIHKDGGIYDKDLQTYTTGVALMAFREANAGGKYDTIIKNAGDYLKKTNSSEGMDPKDARFGGASYDGKRAPDLSNTQVFMDALISAGIDRKDPALQNALKFVSRCQNLAGEHNDQEFAKKANKEDKGGFVYSPVNADKSPAKTPDGGLKSAGAMTYAGLKSFLYAGVDKKDERVKAAIDWIQRNYTLTENPGSGKSGLFYYYHTMAKALDAYGEKEITDAKGQAHDWRKELAETLIKAQKTNGSWEGERSFGENNPDLATAFALLTLSYCTSK